MSAYGFKIQKFSEDHFRLYWTVDYHYPTSRLRWSRGFSRDTDLHGAHTFARKHQIPMPLVARNAV